MKSEEIMKAKALFNLGETETVHDIKKKINTYIREWHPDTSMREDTESTQKSVSLIKAKEVLLEYVDNYKISFKKQDVENYLSPNEQWMNRFGSDHVWGKNSY